MAHDLKSINTMIINKVFYVNLEAKKYIKSSKISNAKAIRLNPNRELIEEV